MKRFLLLQYGFFLCFAVQAQIQVTGLRTESLKDPVGIDARWPRLSWQLDSKEKNSTQLAYEVRVGQDAVILSRNNKLVWQTGKVASPESLHLAYAGIPLQSGKKYYWQVRIWDNKGHVSAWSKMACWQMGLLTPEDWKAHWIGLDVDYTSPSDDHRRLPARMVRHGFRITKPITRATVFFSGLGLSELYVNGTKVGDRVMDPVTSNYDKRIPYTAFDITTMLQQGDNTP